MNKNNNFLKKANVFLFMLIFLASLPSWIKPSAAVSGLSSFDQIIWIIWPLLIIFNGTQRETRIIKKVTVCTIGYLMLFAFIYHVVAISGILLNIGHISVSDAMEWASPWLYICLITSVGSLMLTIIDIIHEVKR
ncbi:MAG: hypothetical protein ACI4LC_01860 [Emergencia sp.]